MGDSSGVNEKEAGIFNKNDYYQGRLNGITIYESIGLDLKLIEQKKAEGFDPKSLKTILIGGCYSSESIDAMIDFIKQVNPAEQVRLVVTDINKEAFDLIRKYPIKVPPNIKLEMFQGDLTKLGLKNGSVDYVRMDYAENFIPLSQQQALLSELHRVTSDNGIVASMMDIVPAATKLPEKLSRHITNAKGSIVDTYRTSHHGFNTFLPSEEFIQSSTKKAGFAVSYIDSGHNYSLDRTHSKLAVFEKTQKPINHTPFRNTAI